MNLKIKLPEWTNPEDFNDRISALVEQLYTVKTSNWSLIKIYKINYKNVSTILHSQLNYHI